jgi:hypothetical protein
MTAPSVVLHNVYKITAALLEKLTSRIPRETVGMHNLQALEEFAEVTKRSLQFLTVQTLPGRHGTPRI